MMKWTKLEEDENGRFQFA